MQKLLLLSNGHGEDAIAARIAEQCQNLPNPPELAVLPMVGEGHAYQKLNIPLLAPVQKMPSGGFIYMDSRQLWRDIQGGLLNLTRTQYQAVKQWSQEGGKILAVGDIVPLLFAWLSGAEYAFVGTAKSEYYLRDQSGWLPSTHGLRRKLGSDYFPWERWLLSRPNCKAVFPRDSLTAENLRRLGIPAFDLGNPMMDGLHSDLTAPELPRDRLPEIILLLPGSRSPEVLNNWQIILQAVQQILQTWPDRPWLFLTAIAPSLSLQEFKTALNLQNWQKTSTFPPFKGGLGG
ncbi:MAG: lipid-A-disaccharide synthase-related protein, partial [Microcystaceae cyanobacterium]